MDEEQKKSTGEERAGAGAQAKLHEAAEKGGHRLQEQAQKARDAALRIAVRVVHSAE